MVVIPKLDRARPISLADRTMRSRTPEALCVERGKWRQLATAMPVAMRLERLIRT